MENRTPNVDDIYLAALERQTASERSAFLEAACAGNPELRRRVERLLEAQAKVGSFLESPAPEICPTLNQPASESAGALIGPYKLLEQIGEGGMGTVWMAQQTEPVKRVVAVKLIKAGMDSRQVIARFEAERQALALMDHANIAKVLDAGTTGFVVPPLGGTPEDRLKAGLQTGRPYFVMELVRGVPITKYCDDHHLTPRQRLELFIPVCQAVQHAHQKGIIHRDLKPSNVLVALYDGKPVPKVIDFGVAKAAGQALTDKTLVTGFGNIVGTLEYMSPEQAEVNQLDIDTRSDIYSLGVLLYELLAGSPPFSRKDLEKAGMLEMLRVIREQEPSKPSTKLSSSDALPSLSANRGTEPAKLTKLVRGELDWIVMKALEKDRNRRYETANGFAADVQRYLADEPVQACPPSAAYRLAKFARRNKRTLAAACALILAVLAVVGTIGWTIRDRSARQARVTSQVELILEDVERLQQEQKWDEALAVVQRAQAALAAGDADAEQERVRQIMTDLELVSILEEIRLLRGEWREEGSFDLKSVGPRYAEAFRHYGVDVESLPVEESARRLESRPAVCVALAQGLDDWAYYQRLTSNQEGARRLLALASAVDPDPWRAKVRKAVAADDANVLAKFAESEDMVHQSPTNQVLLASSFGQSRPELAIALLERACEAYPGDFLIHYDLASMSSRYGRRERAIRHYTAARVLRPRNAVIWTNLGAVFDRQMKPDEAIACYRRAIELSPKFPLPHYNLGTGLSSQGKLDEAVDCYREAIRLKPDFAEAHHNLGNALKAQGKIDEAIACYRRAIEANSKLASTHNDLGVLLDVRKKSDEAIACYRKAIEIDPNQAHPHYNLGNALKNEGQLDEAIACYRRAIELNPENALIHGNLGSALQNQGQLDEAINSYRKAIELDPKDPPAHGRLGNALKAEGQLDEAIACYQEVIKLSPQDVLAHYNLGIALKAQGKLDEAIHCYREAIEIDPKSAWAYNSLGTALAAKGQLDEAIAAHRKAIELDPKSPAAHSNLGLTLQGQQRLDEAIQCYRTVIELAPLDPRGHFNLATALYAQQKVDEAIASFRRAIEVDPKDAEAHVRLGSVLKIQGKLDDAIACYRSAIEVAPEDFQAHNKLGEVLLRQGKLDEAMACFRKAVAIEPKISYFHNNLGAALARQGRFDEAIACIRKAIKLDPQYAPAHYNLAGVHKMQGRIDEAIACYRHTIELDPKHADALNEVAWHLATSVDHKLRNPAEAVKLAEASIKLRPEDGDKWNTLGVARYRASDWKGAIEALGQSVRLRKGGDGVDWFFLAMAHWQLGQQDEAQRLSEKAIQWMEKNAKDNEELQRFRKEAEGLMNP